MENRNPTVTKFEPYFGNAITAEDFQHEPREKLVKSYTIIVDTEHSLIREIAPLPQIENLAFKGGGVKGAAYVGALQHIDSTIGLNTIKRVSGASAGSITAMMVALGLSSEQIRQISKDTPLSSLVESVPRAGMKSIVLYNRLNIEIDDKALDSGNNLLAVCKKIIRDRVETLISQYRETFKTLNIDLNCIKFKDLSMIAKLCPEANFKDLYVSAVKLSKDANGLYQAEVVYFSTESEESKEMEVALAVRMSASIPYFFQAINYNGNLYIDGGCLDNFPINIFDDEKYRPLDIVKSTNDYGSNLCTLGLRVDSHFECENALYQRSNMINKQTSYPELVSGELKDYATNAKNTESTNLSNHELYNKYSHTTIQLDDHNVDAVDFGISNENLNELITQNHINTANWFNTYRDKNTVMVDNTYSYKDEIEEAVKKLCSQLTKRELAVFVKLLEKKTPGLIIVSKEKETQHLDAYYEKITAIAKQVLSDKNDESAFSKLTKRLETIILDVKQVSKISDTTLNPVTRVMRLFNTAPITSDKVVLLEYLDNALNFAKKNINNPSMSDDDKIKTVLSMLAAALGTDSPYHYLLNSLLNDFKIKKEDVISPYYDIRYQIDLQFNKILKTRDQMRMNKNNDGASACQIKLNRIKLGYNKAIKYINDSDNNGNKLSEREKASVLLKFTRPAFISHTIHQDRTTETNSSSTILNVANTYHIDIEDIDVFRFKESINTHKFGVLFSNPSDQLDSSQNIDKLNKIKDLLDEQIKNLNQIIGQRTLKSSNTYFLLQALRESFELVVKMIIHDKPNHDSIMNLISIKISEIKRQCGNHQVLVINAITDIQETFEALRQRALPLSDLPTGKVHIS